MSSLINDFTITRLMEAEELKLAGRHEDALSLLSELLEEDPANVTALEEVAENELELSRYERAGKAARRAVRLDGTSYIGHYVRGSLAARERKWPIATRSLRKANDLKPNAPEILRCLGYVLYSSGSRMEGLVTLERALNLDPENVQILCTLASVRMQTGSAHAAHRLYKKALTIDPLCFPARRGADAALKRVARRGTSV